MNSHEIVYASIALIAGLIAIFILLRGLSNRHSMAKHIWTADNAIIKNHWLRISYCMLIFISAMSLFLLPVLEEKETVRTAHVLFAVDTSKSQAAERPLGSANALEKSKTIIEKICTEFPDVRTSLYGFTQYTRSHAYFSDSAQNRYNCGYVQSTLDNVLHIESVAGSGSNIARAIMITSDTFPREAKSKILILFTDGQYTNAEEEFVQAFANVRKNDVRLIIVGAGAKDGAFIPIYDDAGKIIALEKSWGKNVVSALNDGALRTIASETGGKYFYQDELDGIVYQVEINLIREETPQNNFYSSFKMIPLVFLILASMALLKLLI